MDVAALGVSVDSKGVVTGTDALDRFTKAANDAGTAADRVGTDSKKGSDGIRQIGEQAKKTDTAFSGLARQARLLGGALAAAFSVRAIAQAADAWSDMQSRVGAAVKDMEAAPELMQRMVGIANASYSPLSQTVEIYSRNVSVLQEMGRSASEAADFTEALNNALVITATRGERAASVQNALSKAMAVGRIDAQGLETVLANGGAVAEALAAELNTTVNGLRGMASQGKITGDVIANALIGRFDELRARAEEMPATMEDGVVRIKNNFIALVGTLDQTLGISQRIAEALLWVADNLKNIAAYAAIAATAWVTYRAGVAGAAAAQAIMNVQSGVFLSSVKMGIRELGLLRTAYIALTVSIRAAMTALLANPFGLAVTAVAGFTAALYANRDAQVQVGNEAVRVGDVMLGVWEAVQQGLAIVQTLFVDGWQAALGKISPALVEIGRLFDRVFSFIGNVVRTQINSIIGVFVGLSSSIKALFSGGSVTEAFSAAQGQDYVGKIASTVRGAVVELASMGRAAREAGDKSEAASEQVTKLVAANDNALKASKAAADALKQRNDATEKFISGLEDEIQKIGLNEKALRALEVAKARDAAATDIQRAKIDELAAAREKALSSNAHIQFMTDFANEIDIASFALERQRGELFLTGTALEVYRQTTDALIAARREGIALSDQEVAALQRQNAQMTSSQAMVTQQADEWQRIIEMSKDATANGIQAMQDQLNAARNVVGGFFAQWESGMRSGESAIQSFANSAVNALNRIADRLMDRSIMGFLDSIFPSGSSGGLLGSILGSATPNALGGVYGSPQKFAKGGSFTNQVVSSPTLFRFAKGGALGEMGEAGPEAIMPLKRGADGSLGVQMHGPQKIEIVVRGEAGPLFVPIVEEISSNQSVQVTRAGLQAYDEQLPNRFQQIASDERLRS